MKDVKPKSINKGIFRMFLINLKVGIVLAIVSRYHNIISNSLPRKWSGNYDY
jgi:hypothetical protein